MQNGDLMFKWLNKQGVESDKGFIVQWTGRFTIEYREHSKTIIVYIVDIGKNDKTGQYIIFISSDNFKKWDDESPIDNANQQEEIKRNFVEAIAFQNILVEFNDDTTEYYRPGG